jgi:hypothetical protein
MKNILYATTFTSLTAYLATWIGVIYSGRPIPPELSAANIVTGAVFLLATAALILRDMAKGEL